MSAFAKNTDTKKYKQLTAGELRNFGDPLAWNTTEDELLIGYSNCQLLPPTRTGAKNFDQTNLILDYNFDHVGLAETGRYWPLVADDDRLPQRFRSHFLSKKLYCTTACNKHDKVSGSYQLGGTSSLSTGNLVGRIIGANEDSSGLGRWTWQRFRGQGEATTCIVSCYKPVPPNEGSGSVYAQKLTFLSSINREVCPRQAFLDGLASAVTEWKAAGNQLLIMGDINEYISSHKMKAFFATLGMREMIMEGHGNSGPADTRSNRSDVAIDGIWGTLGLSIKAGGYLPFHKGSNSNHLFLSVKITSLCAFGTKSPPTRLAAAIKLRMKHPRGQQKYNTAMRSMVQSLQLPARYRHLLTTHFSPPSPQDITEYEEIDRLRILCRRRANTKFCRMHMSAVYSSRRVNKDQLRMRLAEDLIRRKDDLSKAK
mmetsp:Transcript_53808/g.161028  ORF Transcript_53808/g.161028 Transcript_53808/m.161028 type:complete len:426 (-) Transcript_53808:3458-4735(-)